MKRIALTGNTGMGKSTVAGMFAEQGVATLDADVFAHRAIAPHTKVWGKIFERYGKGILLADGVIDRPKLAQLVFQDPRERRFLESVVHPPVKEAIEHELATLKHRGTRYAIVEVQLLFEARWEKTFDLVVVVTCNRESQIKRCQEKLGVGRAEVLQRIASQWPIEKKTAKADILIDNSGTLEETYVQVKRLFHQWEKGDFLL